jgi:hypothetical protein
MMERTTGEIRAELGRTGLDRSTKQRLLAFLQESDFVKFADITPRVGDAYALLAEGRALIEATRPVTISAPDIAAAAPQTAVPQGFSENGRRAEGEKTTHE